MACSSGCPTQDHASWGECVRAKSLKTQWLGGVQPSFGEQKRFAAVNDKYRAAVKDGLVPDSVSPGAINKAYEEAAA